MANAPHGHARAMASRKHLSYAVTTKLQAVELAERLFQGGSCKILQGGLEENPRVLPNHGRPDRFVDVMAFTTLAFSYDMCVLTSYDGHEKENGRVTITR